jgi:hypothetical protein
MPTTLLQPRSCLAYRNLILRLQHLFFDASDRIVRLRQNQYRAMDLVGVVTQSRTDNPASYMSYNIFSPKDMGFPGNERRARLRTICNLRQQPSILPMSTNHVLQGASCLDLRHVSNWHLFSQATARSPACRSLQSKFAGIWQVLHANVRPSQPPPSAFISLACISALRGTTSSSQRSLSLEWGTCGVSKTTTTR